MQFLFLKIKKHWEALLCAILFSLIAVSPHLIFLVHEGTQFRGVYQTFSDDEEYYQARISSVIKGELSIGNPYLKEHQGDPFIQPPVAEWLLAAVIFCVGISTPQATMLGDIIFVLLDFMMLYFLLWKMTNLKSLAIGYTCLFFTFFISTFGRPISPQVTVVFLLSGLILIWRLFSEKESFVRCVDFVQMSLGLLVGMSFFISPYYWTTLMLIYGFWILGELLLQKRSWVLVKKTLWFFLTLFPFVCIYAVYMYRASKFPGYVDATLRFGLIHSHWPGGYTNILLGVLLVIIFLVARTVYSKVDRWLVASLVASIFILNWQNVITGQYLQFSSHYLLATILFAILVLAITHKTLKNYPSQNQVRWRKVVIVCGISITIFALIILQRGEIKTLWNNLNGQNIQKDLQAQSAVFDWLNQNTVNDSVIYTLGGDYDFLIPIYTHNKVYYNFYATLFVMSTTETENRWLIQNIFKTRIDPDYITEHQREFWGNRFIDGYAFGENRRKIVAVLTGKTYKPLPQLDPVMLENLEQRFDVLKGEYLYKVLTSYSIQYIFLSREYSEYDRVKATLDRLKFLTRVATIDGQPMYKINSKISQ